MGIKGEGRLLCTLYLPGLPIGPYLERRCGQQHMRGLGHIGSMQAVVVGHIGMVVTLQGQQVGDKCICWDLKCLEQVPFLVHDRPPVRTSASG